MNTKKQRISTNEDDFISFTKRLIAVPKKEIDEQLKLEREKKEKRKEAKKK